MTSAATEGPTTTSASLLSSRDLRFMLDEWLGLEELARRPEYGDTSAATLNDVLQLAQRIAAERFAPHAKEADQREPELEDGAVSLIPEIGDALEAHAQAGFLGMSMDASLGGAQLPHLLETTCTCWFDAANVSTAVYHRLTTSAARLIQRSGSSEQVDAWVRPMLDGRFLATMCLSETQAGSSLGDLTTRAEPQADGTHLIFGSKMWIGAGDHTIGENIVHLVLARLPDAPIGSAGISLFIVPKWLMAADGTRGPRNDVVVAGINHKMGQRGTVNAVLGFGEGAYLPTGTAGAIGYLVGHPNRGLAAMFQMINESRLGVGAAAAAIGYTAYLRSLRYARERIQGREPGSSPETAPVPIIRHADVRRMLLKQKCYVEGALSLVLYAARLVDDSHSAPTIPERERAQLLLSTLTPVVKSWPAQWALEANDLAIQIHGGYGYARDYDVERLYRDNRISSIYEGTHGIQAQDLVERRIFRDKGAGLRVLIDEIEGTMQRAHVLPGLPSELASELGVIVDLLATTNRSLVDAAEAARANSTLYMEALGHIVVAWLWLEQVLASGGKDGDFYDGKRNAARFFYRYELPRVQTDLQLLGSGDRLALDTDEAWF